MSDNPINHDQTYDASAEAPDNTHQQPDNVAPADSASHIDSDATADGAMQKASTLPTDDDIDMYAEEVEEEAIESLPPTIGTEASRLRLGGMFRNWFLDYASYVILERAVPHIDDGLKPVQRRILHSMKTLDDGRFNKVANIVGNTMQYHPHGDASIKRRSGSARAERAACRHSGKLGQHPHRRRCRRRPLYRGPSLGFCARDALQRQDYRLGAELRRPQEGACNASGKVPVCSFSRVWRALP